MVGISGIILNNQQKDILIQGPGLVSQCSGAVMTAAHPIAAGGCKWKVQGTWRSRCLSFINHPVPVYLGLYYPYDVS